MSSTSTTEEVVAGLDYEFTPACEHPEHGKGKRYHPGDEPAKFLIHRGTCPECRSGPYEGSPDIYLCQPAWDIAGQVGLSCGYCYAVLTRGQVWHVLAVLP